MSLEDFLASHIASMGAINQQSIDHQKRMAAIQTKFVMGDSVEAATELNQSLDELFAETKEGEAIA